MCTGVAFQIKLIQYHVITHFTACLSWQNIGLLLAVKRKWERIQMLGYNG